MEQISYVERQLPMKVIIVKVIAYSLVKEKEAVIQIDSFASHLNKPIKMKMPFNIQ